MRNYPSYIDYIRDLEVNERLEDRDYNVLLRVVTTGMVGGILIANGCCT